VVTRETAARVRDAVVEAIDPLEIILFGSVAQVTAGNDLDLLVVTDDDSHPGVSDRRAALRSALRPFRRMYDIDDYVVSRSRFAEYLRRGSPFVSKVVSEGICIYMRDGTEAWRRQAEEERSTSDYLRTGEFHRGACYHAQQCVEKSIKTMLLTVGWELEKIHSIHRLTAIAADHRVAHGLSLEDIDFLDEIYRGRYPAESGLLPLGDPTAADAERAVTLANKSLATLHTFLAARSQPEASEPSEGPLTDHGQDGARTSDAQPESG
jgi:HEPN domain-containing protein/predicted nucleotidyltransferase